MKKYRYEIILTAVFIIAVGAIYISGITCPILELTGIPCASCGMTRAFLSLIRLDIGAAFYYHPLFPAVPFIWLMLFFRNKFSKRQLIFFSISTIVIFVGVYLLRLFVFENSLIYIL